MHLLNWERLVATNAKIDEERSAEELALLAIMGIEFNHPIKSGTDAVMRAARLGRIDTTAFGIKNTVEAVWSESLLVGQSIMYLAFRGNYETHQAKAKTFFAYNNQPVAQIEARQALYGIELTKGLLNIMANQWQYTGIPYPLFKPGVWGQGAMMR